MLGTKIDIVESAELSVVRWEKRDNSYQMLIPCASQKTPQKNGLPAV